MHELKEKVNKLVKEFKRKSNPYKEEGEERVHPHQMDIIRNKDLIFRRVPKNVSQFFSEWLIVSELGSVFNDIIYLTKVINYINLRSTAYGREGFILRNSHITQGTDKIPKFNGDRATFYKYLYALEQLGVIIIDKRMYANFIWINYDVVGKYKLLEQHSNNTKFSDNSIEEWKIKNRIYNLDIIDHKARLELMWAYQFGHKSHYDMFDDNAFNTYSKGVLKHHQVEVGDNTVNSFDNNLRALAYHNRMSRNTSGIESRPISKNRLPTETFNHGGVVNYSEGMVKDDNFTPSDTAIKLTKAKAKKLESDGELYNNVSKIISGETITEIDDKPNVDWLNSKAADLDWSKVDIAAIDFSKIDDRQHNTFKRFIVSQMDTWFVEGLNNSNRSNIDGIKYTSFITPFPPRQAEGKAKYYGQVSSIYTNIYLRLKDSGTENIRLFCKWLGKNYFHTFNELSWFSVANSSLVTEQLNRKGVVPGWHYFTYRKSDGSNKILDHFIELFTKALREYKEKQHINSKANSVANKQVVAEKQHSNDDVVKLKEQLKQNYLTQIEDLKNKHASEERVAQIRYNQLFKLLVDKGYDAQALLSNKLEKSKANEDDAYDFGQFDVDSLIRKHEIGRVLNFTHVQNDNVDSSHNNNQTDDNFNLQCDDWYDTLDEGESSNHEYKPRYYHFEL